jgi:integrase
MPSIPRSIEPRDVRQVLAHCDRRTALGSRDYAILLLLARLGLRAGEIAFLKLDDIDWDAATLSVRGKGGQVHVLPLPSEVGKAIAAYLRKRPACTSRRVFLRARAPLQGFCCRDKPGCGRLPQAMARDCMTSGIASRFRSSWVGIEVEPRSRRACRSCRLTLGTSA